MASKAGVWQDTMHCCQLVADLFTRLISVASDELTYAERRHRSGIDVITVSQQVLCCKE